MVSLKNKLVVHGCIKPISIYEYIKIVLNDTTTIYAYMKTTLKDIMSVYDTS